MKRLLILILGLSMAGGALFVLASSDPQGVGGGEIDDASRARLESVLREADRRGKADR